MLPQKLTTEGGALLSPEHPRWQALLLRSKSDVYHQPGYLRAAAAVEEGELRVALVEAAGVTLGVPLILRPLPFEAAGFDATSPYGYPCPIGNAVTAGQWSLVWEELRRLLADHGVISAFLRLHPLLTSPECLQGVAEDATLVEHGACVHLQLDQEEQHLWSETRPRFRSNINALRRDGWRFVADDWSLLPAFLEIYEATMRRAGARDFYYFPSSYYSALRDGLGADAVVHGVLDPAGQPASAGLFLRHGPLVQYHLGGTAPEHLASAPAKLLFHEVRLWYRRAGARQLHLGGGFGSRNDSLYRFKAGFSKRTSPFHTLRLVIEPQGYRALTEKWERIEGRPSADPDGFFPAYRAPFSPAVS